MSKCAVFERSLSVNTTKRQRQQYTCAKSRWNSRQTHTEAECNGFFFNGVCNYYIPLFRCASHYTFKSHGHTYIIHGWRRHIHALASWCDSWEHNMLCMYEYVNGLLFTRDACVWECLSYRPSTWAWTVMSSNKTQYTRHQVCRIYMI